jgi:transcriptional regulator with XRE-family HTH domain
MIDRARRHRCRSCGAAVHGPGALCRPCAHNALAHNLCPVPEGFYDSRELRDALARYDFGVVFRAVRKVGRMSQEELGFLVGLSQSRVSAVERGKHHLRDVGLIARVATALGIPARLLGFSPSTGSVDVDDEEVSWVDRRDFLGLVSAATVGSNLHPDIQRLAELLPAHAEPVTRPRIGHADVDAIEAITDGFRSSDYSYGGGLCRAAAIAQLHQVGALEDAVCSDEVRTRLVLATADLAWVAAWASWDVNNHDDARRLWTYALDSARRAENHPRSTDLAIGVLLDIAYQALHLDRPDEALRLVQLGFTAMASQKHEASASTRTDLYANLAWCRAKLGEAEPCQRAMGQEEEEFGRVDPSTAPPWARHVKYAEIASHQAHALALLSRTQQAFLPTAIERLRDVVDGDGLTYARTRVVHLPDLAASYFRTGDVDSAVAIGSEAVTAISGLSSARTHARLGTVAHAAESFAHKSDVADLRQRLQNARA